MLNFFKNFFIRSPVSSFGRTDTGQVRSQNEDSFCILEDRGLFLVADGMGGHNAGEVASRLAVEFLVDFLSPAALRKRRGNPQEIRHFLISSLLATNREVIARAQTDEALHGMGCTLIIGLIDRRTLHLCHVGDTRCYRDIGRDLLQLTTDHSLVAEADEFTHPTGNPRHILTRAIGFPFPEDPEYSLVSVTAGDRLLFCSDGLWSMLSKPQIQGILSQAETPETACEMLVDEANKAGGRDNITTVVVFC